MHRSSTAKKKKWDWRWCEHNWRCQHESDNWLPDEMPSEGLIFGSPKRPPGSIAYVAVLYRIGIFGKWRRRKKLLTSILWRKAFRSLKRKELPAEIVWAVSPAQNNPSGFRQSIRNTGGVRIFSKEPCFKKLPLHRVSMRRLSCVSSTYLAMISKRKAEIFQTKRHTKSRPFVPWEVDP